MGYILLTSTAHMHFTTWEHYIVTKTVIVALIYCCRIISSSVSLTGESDRKHRERRVNMRPSLLTTNCGMLQRRCETLLIQTPQHLHLAHYFNREKVQLAFFPRTNDSALVTLVYQLQLRSTPAPVGSDGNMTRRTNALPKAHIRTFSVGTFPVKSCDASWR